MKERLFCILVVFMLAYPVYSIAPSVVQDVKNCSIYYLSDDWNKTYGEEMGNDCTRTFIKEGGYYFVVGSLATYSRGGYDAGVTKFSQPELEIEIKGGLGITIIIRNVGNRSFSNLEFEMRLEGMIFLGGYMEGKISLLPPGKEIEIYSLILGIGKARITVRAGEISKTVNCFILGPFVIIE